MIDPPRRPRVLVLFGTRPEAIKLAPVVQALRAAAWAEPIVAVTGQHREMLDQVIEVFDLRPEVDLDLMRPGQSLTDLAGRAARAVGEAVRRIQPDLLLVQGDTTSAFVGGLAAAYERVPVGHVEAGLRSFDRDDPYPEEINRRLISVVSTLHFAPTERARRNLIAEGIDPRTVSVTGNTVVDALLTVVESRQLRDVPPPAGLGPADRLILVTLHRRESWGDRMVGMARALRAILDRFPDTRLLCPMHRNPIVRRAIEAGLGDHPRAVLVEPLDYLRFVKAMQASYLIVTDSGGVQEEAPTLGKPVLVTRATTERPEGIEAGTARLIGTSPEVIQDAVGDLLDDPAAYRSMARAANPFGDGHAAERILTAIRAWAIDTGRVIE